MPVTVSVESLARHPLMTQYKNAVYIHSEFFGALAAFISDDEVFKLMVSEIAPGGTGCPLYAIVDRLVKMAWYTDHLANLTMGKINYLKRGVGMTVKVVLTAAGFITVLRPNSNKAKSYRWDRRRTEASDAYKIKSGSIYMRIHEDE